MFWERFYNLCIENGTKPYKLGVELGISAGTFNKWKNGTMPNSAVLMRIAEYFDVSTDYLLGRTPYKNPTDDPAVEYGSDHPLTDEEKELVKQYVNLVLRSRRE